MRRCCNMDSLGGTEEGVRAVAAVQREGKDDDGE
jgi:hypothetical protein